MIRDLMLIGFGAICGAGAIIILVVYVMAAFCMPGWRRPGQPSRTPE